MTKKQKPTKLTPALLRRMVMEELKRSKSKISETLEQEKERPEKVKAEEVEADELADTLAKNIDYVKALKIQESQLIKRLRLVREAKRALLTRFGRR